MHIDPHAMNELGKALSSGPLKELVTPAAKEIGAFLGDMTNLMRFYMTRNAELIFTMWANSRPRGTAIGAEEVERVMPLLPLASTVSDEELQKRWAALLEAASSEENGYMPSFGQTLSQLNAEEAQFLERLWNFASQPSGGLPEYLPGMVPLEREKLVSIFDPSIETGMSPAERQYFKHQLSPEQIANYKRLAHAQLVIDDMARLGIIAHISELSRRNAFVRASFGEEAGAVLARDRLMSRYSLTHYGVHFIKAVSSKQDSRGN
jgi:hypothetical protein